MNATVADLQSLRFCIVGNGRAGRAFAQAMRFAELQLLGPLGRGEHVPECDVALLCVPERELQSLAGSLKAGPLVGHCSASSQLGVLAPHGAFSIHPLMTLTAHSSIAGASCAVDGSTPDIIAFATELAERLRMTPLHVPSEKRALYHAAASIASNFLVTLEDGAERAAAECNVPRSALVPLVEAAVRSWAAGGFADAITAPIARGDRETVVRQREAIAQWIPDFLPSFDALAAATQRAVDRGGLA